MRWILHLQAYDFTLRYIPGADNAADFLSRYITNAKPDSNQAQETEQYINMLINHAVPKDLTISEIVEATQADTTIQKVIGNIKAAKWTKEQETVPFYPLRTQLTTKNDILLKGSQIVMPTTLRDRALEIAHAHHQGIAKTIALLREKVWWPGLSKQTEKVIKECHACQVVTPQQVKCEPLLMTEIPKRPWETLAIDLKGPFPTGDHILVLIDYYSRYPVTAVLDEITSARVIQALKEIFAIFGYPNTITSDNGKQFISTEYKSFLLQHGIRPRVVTPYWPSANGEVERFNRTLGKAIQTAHAENKDWHRELPGFLLQYRTTPHSSTGIAPALALLRNNPNNGLPTLVESPTKTDKIITTADRIAKQKMKSYADHKRNAKPSNVAEGDLVLLKNLRRNNKLEAVFEPTPYKVIKEYHRSVKLQNNAGKHYVRSKAHVKKFLQNEHSTNPRLETKPVSPSYDKIDLSQPSNLTNFTFMYIAPDDVEEEEERPIDNGDSDRTITADEESEAETIPYNFDI